MMRKRWGPPRSMLDEFEDLGLTGSPADVPMKKTPLAALSDEIDAIDRDWAHIYNLRAELAQVAQIVHQAYHGASGPDADHGTWETCNRGACKRVRDVLRESHEYQKQRGIPDA